MTDDRPLPQYGEYATPEQQAAAMGKAYVPAIAPPSPETRVNLAPPGQPAARSALLGNAIDRFATIFQLGIGFVILLNTDFFHLATYFNTAASETGLPERLPASVDHLGWVILVANVVLLAATMLWASVRIRRDKLAFWVPVIGYVSFVVVISIILGIVA